MKGSQLIKAHIPDHAMQTGDRVSLYSGRDCAGVTLDINGIKITTGKPLAVLDVLNQNEVLLKAPGYATSTGYVSDCRGQHCHYVIEQHVALLFQKTFNANIHTGYDMQLYRLQNNYNTLLISKNIPNPDLKLGHHNIGVAANNANVRFSDIKSGKSVYDKVMNIGSPEVEWYGYDETLPEPQPITLRGIFNDIFSYFFGSGRRMLSNQESSSAQYSDPLEDVAMQDPILDPEL